MLSLKKIFQTSQEKKKKIPNPFIIYPAKKKDYF